MEFHLDESVTDLKIRNELAQADPTASGGRSSVVTLSGKGSFRISTHGRDRYGLQCRRASGYTLRQAERAGIVERYTDYPHTRLYVDIEAKIHWALENRAFMLGVG